MKKKVNKWNSIFSSSRCGGYYSDNPCRARSCNSNDSYCESHKKMLKKIKGKK